MEESYKQLTDSEIKKQFRLITIVYIMAAVITALIIVGFIFWARKRTNDLGMVTHTQGVLISLTEIKDGFDESDIEGREAILQSADNQAVEGNRLTVREGIERFKSLTQDNPRQQLNAQRLSVYIEKRFATVDLLMELSKKKSLQIAVDYMKANHVLDELRNVQYNLRAAQDEELRLLEERRKTADSSIQAFTVTGAFALAFLFLTLPMNYFFVRLIINRFIRAGKKFRDAYINARTGQDGVIEIPEEIADEIMDILSEDNNAHKSIKAGVA